jgi:hypothetical protein
MMQDLDKGQKIALLLSNALGLGGGIAGGLIGAGGMVNAGLTLNRAIADHIPMGDVVPDIMSAGTIIPGAILGGGVGTVVGSGLGHLAGLPIRRVARI